MEYEHGASAKLARRTIARDAPLSVLEEPSYLTLEEGEPVTMIGRRDEDGAIRCRLDARGDLCPVVMLYPNSLLPNTPR